MSDKPKRKKGRKKLRSKRFIKGEPDERLVLPVHSDENGKPVFGAYRC